MNQSNLLRQSRQFEYGRAAGFYDALFDDGLNYLSETQRHSPQDKNRLVFLAGYKVGRLARRGSPVSVRDVVG